MSHIVNPAWLAQRLTENPNSLVIVDCRFVLGQPAAGRESYNAEHITGSVYMDLEQDLSAPVSVHGGRHPLPDLGAFLIKLGTLGMDADTVVVAYDDQGGAMAARFWWMLHFLGHPHVFILDGGFAHWKASGYATSGITVNTQHDKILPDNILPDTYKHSFQPHVLNNLLVSIDEVKANLAHKDGFEQSEKMQSEKIHSEKMQSEKIHGGAVLLDSREHGRYLGFEEPIDHKAGHIPGAINSFWKESLDVNGLWKSAAEQYQRFAHISPEQEIIVYCGSGVTACANFVALKEAGFANVKLYAGSWSDWISYSENPVATGEE